MDATSANGGETDRIGEVVDKRYRITGLLGRGGMGNVYRAEHVTIKRPIALKLLHGALKRDDHIKARFEREAFAAGRVDHPNCVTASDFGELEDGTRYLIMELLEGESLADVIKRDAPLPVERALHITRHLLHGLRYAHGAGVVHRDLKPDNIILDAKDEDPAFARLLDFGIAKLLGDAQVEEGGDKLTQAGVAFGTPVYMSPEQAYGESVDARSDLYSLSVMLFEMLTGQPPFEDDDKMAVLHMHTNTPPPRFSEIAAEVDIPADVEAVVRCGLSKRREDRFADADAYLNAVITLMPQWANDAIWSERTPTAIRKLEQLPDADVSIAPTVEHKPQRDATPKKRTRWSRLEVGLAVGVSMLVLLVVLLVGLGGGDGDGDATDPFETYSRELTAGATCKVRKNAVTKLRELGDKRAIPILRDARDRKAKPGAARNNKCLHSAAINAIIALQRR